MKVAKILKPWEFLLELASLELWLAEYNIMKSPSIFVLLFALLSIFSFSASAAPAPEVQEISNLMKQGQLAAALEQANAYIAKHPQDAQTRFMKGLILTEQNNKTEAIKTFSALTRDFPGLPEPYNNLAVLYAAQGKYDEAKTALQMAIRTNPSYATAQENLGDIYAKMATAAYDKALQLDTRNTSAQTKLMLIRELFSKNGNTVPAQTADEKARKPAAGKMLDEKTIVAATAAKPVALPSEKPSAIVAKVQENIAAPKENPDDAAVTAAIEAWAKAWSRRDVDAYLAAYSPKFKPPGGESRTSWEKTRRERITSPKKIVVELTDIHIKNLGANRYQADFRQSYRSDKLVSRTHKVMELVKSGHKWQIIEERSR